jgi:hypothetical protein
MVCIRYRKSTKRALIKKSGRVGQLQAKQPKKDHYNPDRIADPAFKAVFDPKKTYLENARSVDLKQMYEDRLPEFIPPKAAWTLPKLNEEERPIVEKLVNKHVGDFARMARDMKVNRYQWTASQIEKKVQLLNEAKFHVCSNKCLCAMASASSYAK